VRHGESLGNVDPMVYAVTADHAVPPVARVVRAREESEQLCDPGARCGVDNGYLFEGAAPR